MIIELNTQKFLNSGLSLPEYLILLAYDTDTYGGKELAHHLGYNIRTVYEKIRNLKRMGYLVKESKCFYLSQKGRGLIAA